MKVHWHGHSFIELELATGARIAIDPFDVDAGNPTTRVRARDLRLDAVLVTHGHSDHVGSALTMGKPVLAIHEIMQYCASKGLEDAAGTGGSGMNIGGTVQVAGARITMLPAIHTSGFPGEAGPFAGSGGAPAGFLIDDGETRFYHMGDTFLFGDLKTVVGELYAPDIVAVPIGDVFTMGIRDAAIAVEWLKADAAIPIHYNTFPPIKQDADEFAKLAGKTADVHILRPDGSLTY